MRDPNCNECSERQRSRHQCQLPLRNSVITKGRLADHDPQSILSVVLLNDFPIGLFSDDIHLGQKKVTFFALIKSKGERHLKITLSLYPSQFLMKLQPEFSG
jgi:hypothetical protein